MTELTDVDRFKYEKRLGARYTGQPFDCTYCGEYHTAEWIQKKHVPVIYPDHWEDLNFQNASMEPLPDEVEGVLLFDSNSVYQKVENDTPEE